MDESTVSWKQSLENHAQRDCSCEETKLAPYAGPGGLTIIRCGNCGEKLGLIPVGETLLLHRMTNILLEYIESTHHLTRLLVKNPTWRIIMTEEQPQSIHEIESDKVIRLFPGHLVFQSAEDRIGGENCNHRLILEADGLSARCVLCDGRRELGEEEIQAITAAQQAGVIFLKWEARLRAMERLRTGGKKRKRRAQRKKKGPTASKGVGTAAEIPEGFKPVKEAAAQLDLDPKVLRKQVRNGVYEGVKVGGRVYVRIKS